MFSPQWLKSLTKIQFRRRRTFDSGATPKVGSTPRPPAALAQVDIDAIKKAMAGVIEKAQAEDPRTLRARIATLEAELRQRPEPVVQRVEVPVIPAELATQLEASLAELSQAYASWAPRLEQISTLSAAAIEQAEALQRALAIAAAEHPLQLPRRSPRGRRRRLDPLGQPLPRRLRKTACLSCAAAPAGWSKHSRGWRLYG